MSVSFLALLALVTLRIRLLSQAFDYSAVCYYGVALLLLLYVFFFFFFLCLFLSLFPFVIHFISLALITYLISPVGLIHFGL